MLALSLLNSDAQDSMPSGSHGAALKKQYVASDESHEGEEGDGESEDPVILLDSSALSMPLSALGGSVSGGKRNASALVSESTDGKKKKKRQKKGKKRKTDSASAAASTATTASTASTSTPSATTETSVTAGDSQRQAPFTFSAT